MKRRFRARWLFERLKATRELFLPQLDYPYFEFAAAHPFEARAGEFAPVNCAWLADAALLAYVNDPDFIEARLREAGFDRVEMIASRGASFHDTRCIVARRADAVAVIFKGTEPDMASEPMGLKNMLTDVRFSLRTWEGGGKAHEGFRGGLDDVWERVAAAIAAAAGEGGGERAVWFAGHSLGGALATLAAARHGRAAGLYTFGSPRVGDVVFRREHDLPAHRIVHGDDFVTHLPPKRIVPWKTYCHVGRFHRVDRRGEWTDDAAVWGERKRYGARTLAALRPIWGAGRPLLSARRWLPGMRALIGPLEDHAPIFYARRAKERLESWAG